MLEDEKEETVHDVDIVEGEDDAGNIEEIGAACKELACDWESIEDASDGTEEPEDGVTGELKDVERQECFLKQPL